MEWEFETARPRHYVNRRLQNASHVLELRSFPNTERTLNLEVSISIVNGIVPKALGNAICGPFC